MRETTHVMLSKGVTNGQVSTIEEDRAEVIGKGVIVEGESLGDR